jgi:cobalamin biosynthesis Mg chelatase CobN
VLLPQADPTGQTDQTLQSDTITNALPKTEGNNTVVQEKVTEMTQPETKETYTEEEKFPKRQINEEQRSTKRKKKRTLQQKSTTTTITTTTSSSSSTTVTTPSATNEKTKKKKKRSSISKRELLHIQQTVSTPSTSQTRPILSPGFYLTTLILLPLCTLRFIFESHGLFTFL